MDGSEDQPPRDLSGALKKLQVIMSEQSFEETGVVIYPPRSGWYDGLPPKLELIVDGRVERLLALISYIEMDSVAWSVSLGAKLDGASIPRVFWSPIGGPFESRYRDASIIHDYYCLVRSRTWRSTHRMFQSAMHLRCDAMQWREQGLGKDHV